jgi:cytochrome oxidase assembly protein ShyY1
LKSQENRKKNFFLHSSKCKQTRESRELSKHLKTNSSLEFFLLAFFLFFCRWQVEKNERKTTEQLHNDKEEIPECLQKASKRERKKIL